MIVKSGLENYLSLLTRQLYNLTAVDLSESQIKDCLHSNIDKALDRFCVCLSHSRMKHNFENGEVEFNPLHGGHVAIFLWILANTIKINPDNKYLNMPEMLCTLNKIINGLELSKNVDMPEWFFLEHPLGTILGRAKYSNGFFCLQGCTVGAANGKEPLIFPEFGQNVIMLAHSMVLGDSHIGNNVIFSANSTIINQDVPDNSIVFGQGPYLSIKQLSPGIMKEKISIYWDIDYSRSPKMNGLMSRFSTNLNEKISTNQL